MKDCRGACEPFFSKKKMRVEWEPRTASTGQGVMRVALFPPKLPWYFDHGLHHYGRFADCTAPLRPIASRYLSMMPDGRVGKSSLASRSMRRLRRARNCSLVSAEQLARADTLTHRIFLRNVDPRPRQHAEYACVSLRCCLSRNAPRRQPLI